MADANAQVTRGVAGFAKDAVTGVGELAYTAVKFQAKTLQGYTPDGMKGHALDAQILAENMRLGNITPGTVGTDISQGAKAVGSALVKPVTEAWSKGNHIEAVTRAGAEVLTLPWALFKAGKVSEAARAANALKNASRSETVAHAGDGVHVKPQGAAYGRAEDVNAGHASDSGKNCPLEKCTNKGEPVDVLTRYRYNAVGWLTEKHCVDGAYHYDTVSARLLMIDHHLAKGELSEQTQFSYNGVGHLISVSNSGGHIEYPRDAVGRVLSECINGRLIEHHYHPDSGLSIGQHAGAIEEPANAQEAFAALPPVQWQHDRNGGLAQLFVAAPAVRL